MKRDVSSGVLLIIGALAGVAVMALHPTAHRLMTGPDAARQTGINVLAHGVALAAVPVAFLGLLGVSRRLGFPDLALAALVAWGFGAAAVISAAVASGFVAPAVIERLLEAQGGERDVFHALLAYTGFLNQAFAKVYVMATSAAILLWSAAIVKDRRLARSAGIAGILVGAALLLGVLSGYLRLNVHGFGVVTLAQSAWLIWVGVLLCLEDASRPGAAAGPA